MTKKCEIYKCNICKNVVEVISEGFGELVCCNELMKLQTEQTNEAELTEKHKPVKEQDEFSTIIKVGEIEHPMTEEHHIEMIELISENKIIRKYLKPNEKPEFVLNNHCANGTARAYCNIHGLWKGDSEC